MSVTVLIRKGNYRGESIRNKKLVLLKDYVVGSKGGFITVDGSEYGRDKIRVKVEQKDYEIISGDASELITAQKNAHAEAAEIEMAEEAISNETDEEIEERINNRFEILDGMTNAIGASQIKAMTVTGAPGVGKSFGVEEVLKRNNILNTMAGDPDNYVIFKGEMTSIGLYIALYHNAERGKTIVFDDCDGILYDDLSLNLLKAALDTSKVRRICWCADSKTLAKEGVPNSFEFKAGVIFISNIDFDHVRGNRAHHIEALKSRTHYLNLTIHTTREKLIRIKSLLRKGMLDEYGFSDQQVAKIEMFINDNAARLNELSLRMVLKISDLILAFPTRWEEVASHTCMKYVKQ